MWYVPGFPRPRFPSYSLRLVDFLDHATRLIILQPVGGGWVFIHRLLQEHLAAGYEPRCRRGRG